MSSSKLKAGEGDWICGDPKCGNMNFAKRMKCNKCGLSKNDPKLKAAVIKKTGVEIGKEAAERSRGLFSADDWSCKTCGNINWAKRGNCNLCHAPRFSKEEARTGLGGGYFERDGVEYVNRADSDDEYDEFGRKKKKYRASTSRGENYDRAHAQRSGRDSGRRSDSDNDRDRGAGRRQERRSGREVRRRSRSPVPRARDEDDEEEEDEDVSKYQLDEDDDDDDDADSAKYRLDSDSDDGKGASSKAKHAQSGDSARGAERDPHDQRERRERHRDHSESDSGGEAHRAKRKRRNSSSSR